MGKKVIFVFKFNKPLIMRNVFLFLFTLFLVSCVNDTKDNTPAFQAKLNDTFWKAISAKTEYDVNGDLIFVAARDNQFLRIKIANVAVGTYVFGTNNLDNYATFKIDDSSNLLTTAVIPGPVYTLKLVSAGSGYSDSNTALIASTTGTGAGLVLETVVNTTNGAILEYIIKARGTNYKSGDIVTVAGGNGNAKFRVENVQQSNGVVTIKSVANGEITGEFYLNLADETTGQTATFSNGVIYKMKY